MATAIPVSSVPTPESSAESLFFLVTSQSQYRKGFTVNLVAYRHDPSSAGQVSPGELREVPLGQFRYACTDDGGANSVEIEAAEQGKGYGKLLLLKAIAVGHEVNLGFESDHRGLSPRQEQVYASLIKSECIAHQGLDCYALLPAGQALLDARTDDHPTQQPLLIDDDVFDYDF